MRILVLAILAAALASTAAGAAGLAPARIAGRIVTGNGPCSEGAGFGALWVSNIKDNTIARVDPQTNKVTAKVQVGSQPCGVVSGANALWIDGKLHKVGAARIQFDDGNPLSPWTVSTDDGCIDLTLTPEGIRAEDKNLLVAVSRYVQPVGVFRGTVRPPGGSAMQVTICGVTEDHRARW